MKKKIKKTKDLIFQNKIWLAAIIAGSAVPVVPVGFFIGTLFVILNWRKIFIDNE